MRAPLKVTGFITNFIRFAIAVLGVLYGGGAMAAGKYALVVGAFDYNPHDFVPLDNPERDATEMASLLKSIGFELVGGGPLLNPDLQTLRNSIVDFRNAQKDGSIAFFYYAGHAVEIDGKNYLIPINATLETEDDKEVNLMPLDFILDRMKNSGSGRNVVVLDACRVNPLQKPTRGLSRISSGLAPPREIPSLFIAYAASPGHPALDGPPGKHSPYTQALLDHIAKPKLPIYYVFDYVSAQVFNVTNEYQTPMQRYNSVDGLILNESGVAPGGRVTSPTFFNDADGVIRSSSQILDPSVDDPELAREIAKRYVRAFFPFLEEARLSSPLPSGSLLCQCFDAGYSAASKYASIASSQYQTGVSQCRSVGGDAVAEAWAGGWQARISKEPWKENCETYFLRQASALRIGYAVTSDVKWGERVSLDEAEIRLDQEIKSLNGSINASLNVPISTYERSALLFRMFTDSREYRRNSISLIKYLNETARENRDPDYISKELDSIYASTLFAFGEPSQTWQIEAAKLIANNSELRLTAYYDANGVLSIGYRHQGPNIRTDRPISKQDAVTILLDDLNAQRPLIRNLVEVEIDPYQEAAIASLVQDVGIVRFKESAVRTRLNAEDLIGAALALRLWDDGNNRVLATGSTDRREAEAALFLRSVPAPEIAAYHEDGADDR